MLPICCQNTGELLNIFFVNIWNDLSYQPKSKKQYMIYFKRDEFIYIFQYLVFFNDSHCDNLDVLTW